MAETKHKKRKTTTSAAVKRKHNSMVYDTVTIYTLPKGKKEAVKDMAQSKGMSVSAYLIDLIKKDFEKNHKTF